jgi:hypothetical protein
MKNVVTIDIFLRDAFFWHLINDLFAQEVGGNWHESGGGVADAHVRSPVTDV